MMRAWYHAHMMQIQKDDRATPEATQVTVNSM
jgi:hypothetical protein